MRRRKVRVPGILSKRAAKALETLREGGTYETALRRNYLGREKFAYWLEAANGQRLEGFGYATFHELSQAGLLEQDRETIYGSTAHRSFLLKGAR